MTGPEHYREAERLLAAAADSAGEVHRLGQSADVEDREFSQVVTHSAPMLANLIAQAQAHATLALTAAEALGITASQTPHTTDAARDWREVLKPAEQTCPGGC